MIVGHLLELQDQGGLLIEDLCGPLYHNHGQHHSTLLLSSTDYYPSEQGWGFSRAVQRHPITEQERLSRSQGYNPVCML